MDEPKVKKAKPQPVLPHESVYLGNLPSAGLYEKSYMHRDTLSHVVSSAAGNIITSSVDGYLKFWKRTSKAGEIEFVKTFRAHHGPITSLALSNDGLWLASASLDKTIKIFDVLNFDMLNIVQIEYLPNALCWAKEDHKEVLFCSDRESNQVYQYHGIDFQSHSLIREPSQINTTCLKYNHHANVMVSGDSNGIIKYWYFGDNVPEESPLPEPNHLSDSSPSPLTSIEFSPNTEFFATMSADRLIRVFRFRTGKLYRKYDESLQLYSSLQSSGKLAVKLDDLEFGKRLATERELESTPYFNMANVTFDESSNFILFPSMIGIKVVNMITNKVPVYLGKDENCRFLNLALHHGLPQSISLELAASENPANETEKANDPILFATAFKKQRFFLLTRREPDKDHLLERDVLNERPSKDDLASKTAPTKILPKQAILRTTVGDIFIKLLPEVAPLAVENFTTHARIGYYDNLIFHRVIKGFMVQTGDPFGDGTGGESIWGHDFRDEIQEDVKHDVPFTLSMANAGPNTNGSQFFITTVKCPWLDGKHTIFGRVVRGSDVVSKIESVKCDELDKPLVDIKILEIDLIQ